MTEDFAWGDLGSKLTANVFRQASYKKVLTVQCNGSNQLFLPQHGNLSALTRAIRFQDFV